MNESPPVCEKHGCEKRRFADKRNAKGWYWGCPDCRRTNKARYEKSEKGRAVHARYEKSEKGRARDARYDKSEKGIRRRIRWNESIGNSTANLEEALAEREAYEASGSTLPFHEWLHEHDPLPQLRPV